MIEPTDGAVATLRRHWPRSAPPTRTRRALRFALRRPVRTIAALILVVVVLWAIVPSLFVGYSPDSVNVLEALKGPSWGHPFGTDELGRDVFTRVVYGSALTLEAALLAVGIAFVVGGTIGAVAGSLRGWVDDCLMRVIDALMAIPSLLLALAVIVALGVGTVHIGLAIGIADIGLYARVMRGEVLRVRTELYVDSAYATGMRWSAVLRRHILPNAHGPILSLSLLQLGIAILAIASLSFLGYGAAPPAPEWGSLIAEGQSYLVTAWWMATFPGVIVALVVLSANRLARDLERGGGLDLV